MDTEVTIDGDRAYIARDDLAVLVDDMDALYFSYTPAFRRRVSAFFEMFQVLDDVSIGEKNEVEMFIQVARKK